MKISDRGSQTTHSRHFRIARQLLGRQRRPTNGAGQGSQLLEYSRVTESGGIRVLLGQNPCNYSVDCDFAGPDSGNWSE